MASTAGINPNPNTIINTNSNNSPSQQQPSSLSRPSPPTRDLPNPPQAQSALPTAPEPIIIRPREYVTRRESTTIPSATTDTKTGSPVQDKSQRSSSQYTGSKPDREIVDEPGQMYGSHGDASNEEQPGIRAGIGAHGTRFGLDNLTFDNTRYTAAAVPQAFANDILSAGRDQLQNVISAGRDILSTGRDQMQHMISTGGIGAGGDGDGGSNRGINWTVPTLREKKLTVNDRLADTLILAQLERDKYAAKAKMTGYALNAAIGAQVVLGALTTGLSAITTGRQTSIVTAFLGGMSTIAASYLARARGSKEPELSITRVKDLEQFMRECKAYCLDKGHLYGVEHGNVDVQDESLETQQKIDKDVDDFRRRFEELLGNANGERKLSNPV